MTFHLAASVLGTCVIASFAAAGSASAQDTPRDRATTQQMPATAASTAPARPTGQFANWSLGGDSDDMTNRAQQRITLPADDSSSDPHGGKVLAQLIISCGNTYTRDHARSMLFDAGIAMVNAPGEPMLRTDKGKSPKRSSCASWIARTPSPSSAGLETIAPAVAFSKGCCEPIRSPCATRQPTRMCPKQ